MPRQPKDAIPKYAVELPPGGHKPDTQCRVKNVLFVTFDNGDIHYACLRKATLAAKKLNRCTR